MLKKKLKVRLWFIFKIIISLLAIIFVLRRISLADITTLIGSANSLFLVIALIIFTISKIMSASRALVILVHYSIPISVWENLKLYWTGMFYNLFLPGGIGGDIYKTVIIKNKYNSDLRISAGAVLMDRIAGVAALIVLALLMVPFTGLSTRLWWFIIPGIPVTIIGFIITALFLMPRLKGIIGKLLGWSFMVQIFQMLSLLFILKAFGINNNYIEYSLIFLISSVAAMLPVSVGGIGIRELVFFSLSDRLFLDQNVAVTISFSFYLITVLASSLGMISALELKRNIRTEKEIVGAE